MSRKLLFLASLIAVLGLASNGWAATTYIFTDANDILTNTLDGDWMDPCNWDPIPAGVPMSPDTRVNVSYDDYAVYGGVHPVLDEYAGSVGILTIGAYSMPSAGTSKMIVRTGGWIFVTREATVSSNGDLLTGSTTGCPGHLIMTGGSVGFADQYQIGKRTEGRVYMVDDDVNDSAGYPYLYGDRDDETATGGGGYIKFGGANGGTGDARMDIEDGLLFVRGMTIYSDEGYINITEGTMQIGTQRSNPLGDMEAWILYKYYEDDEIECYLGDGEINTTADSPYDGWVTVWCDPRPANCPGLASPKNQSTADLLQLDKLIWDSGATADQHKVYLDTERSEVNEMNAPALVYTGAPNEYTLQSGDVVIGKTHYWRIVEYNDSNVVCISRVLKFTVDSCAMIDDFESYGSGFPSGSYWSCDGDNVAYIARQVGSTYYDNVTEDGSQSMYADYAEINGSDNYGDIYLDPPNGSPIEDWTVGGSANAVSFWYQAPATVEKIQIDIDGGGFVDCNAVLDTCWHQANVRQSELGGGPSDVETFTIRLGDGAYNGTTSTQDVYIDNLAVCTSRCVPEFAENAGLVDYDGDCDVDNWDMLEYDNDWMLYDADRGAFDGNTSGGGGENNVYFTYNAARDMNVAVFDGNNDFIEMPGVAFANFNDKTQALWVYYDTTKGSTDIDINMGNPVQMGTAFNRGYIEMHLPASSDSINNQDTIRYRAGHTNMQAICNFDFENKWIHIAAVRRVVCNGTQLELYVNGALKDTGDCVLHEDNREYGTEEEALGGNPADEGAGGGPGHFAGMIADYRVYDAALSASDIANIYAGPPPSANLWLHYTFDGNANDVSGATHIIPIVSPGDTQEPEGAGSRVLNFKDYDDFGASWAQTFLWP